MWQNTDLQKERNYEANASESLCQARERNRKSELNDAVYQVCIKMEAS